MSCFFVLLGVLIGSVVFGFWVASSVWCLTVLSQSSSGSDASIFSRRLCPGGCNIAPVEYQGPASGGGKLWVWGVLGDDLSVV